MSISPSRITEITTEIVKSSFFNYFIGREETDTKHAVLAKFFPNESVIGSAIVGISTSLGSFWEKVAAQIARENGFEILNPKMEFQPVSVPLEVSALISKYHQQRMVPNAKISINTYNQALNSLINNLTISKDLAFKKLEKGSGIDLLLLKNNVVYAYDLKTVQMNASGGGLYSERLMKWSAFYAIYKKAKGLNNTFNAHIVIPYDPHSQGDWWSHFEGRVYPLDRHDLKLCNNFWDFISGVTNSYQFIELAINNLVSINFPKIYEPSLYSADIQRSYEILLLACNIKNTQPELLPSSFKEKIHWECLVCNDLFNKSIRWFEKNSNCPNCSVGLLK